MKHHTSIIEGVCIRVEYSSHHITAIHYAKGAKDVGVPSELSSMVFSQLREYFEGLRKEFSLPLDHQQGTPFQQQVWSALRDIPYGETRSYKDIAEAIGIPKACRAVGMANNRNPFSIVVPCHRVVGADGKMVGYGGGVDLKVRLLEIEGR